MCADEDEDALENKEKLGLLPQLCNAVHVYHSKDDQALVISDFTKLNPDRLGSNGPKDMSKVGQKVVSIDCRHVDSTTATHANHQYYRLRPEVISDVKQVLAGKRPEEIVPRKRLEHQNSYMIVPKIENKN